MEQQANTFLITLYITASFLTILILLAVNPQKLKQALGKMMLAVAVCALGLYGYGYTHQINEGMSIGVAVVRATIDVLRVFVGGNNWDMVKDALPNQYQQWLFWFVHLAAMFTSASAVITALGSKLICKIRLWLLWMWDISVICGLNEKTLDFGRELQKKGARSIVYVDRNPQQGLASAVEHMGCVLRSDEKALEAGIRFLRSISIKSRNRKIHVYALDPDMGFDRQYAQRILCSMEKRGIDPDNSTLTILCTDEESARWLLRDGDRYGFGSVLAVNEPGLAARMLVKSYPPCDVIPFDPEGNACKDFHAVVIGFGHIGQNVLKQLVINGQFCGNRFHAAVFSPHYSQRMGLLAYECDEMLEQYDITFHASDGRSCEMFDYLCANADTVNYIAVCAGSHSANLEIAEQLRTFLKRRNSTTPIYMCSNSGIFYQDADNRLHEHKLYTVENLCTDRIDRMAMVLHHHYTGTGFMRQNWRNCDYFNRMSSRSAADFWYTILRAAGTNMADAKEHWAPEGRLLENLAKMEHLRWNAFHFTMGFHPMPEQVYQERVAEFRKEREADSNTGYRIARDMDRRFHACLIPWEDLEDYTRKENAVTGQNRNYCENDRENIRAIGEVLRKMDEH